ncbi:Protein of unknown function DUF2207, membrane [Solidesulfovibrio fructosivorans JJ]]|uniref:DUF2207 domain-containing protein n=1 Tax=Solidesulfovibrio fructosivorans JJ] TaxID=596151 RepID=E1JU30_SOLFR|nr:DUF2207 domain-containing protein [Solidesulfovibrio fructosivorans]EFL51960.1 Protein of unknown function DUF2207, membrane [Solidesulfovibrio fructosivorans JJ]]
MNTRRILLCAAILTFFAAGVTVARADTPSERILSFDSRIVIAPDAALTVTETIEAQTAGKTIRHGLVREFPTRYRAPGGKTVTVGFKVLSVSRDGHKEAYHIRDVSNGKKVYMGQKDALLPPGRHTYVLTYRTDGQVGQFPEFDELYWNVTGNGWRLPIDAATAAIVLPEGATVTRYAAYTGRQGKKGRDYTAQKAPGMMTFATTAPLPPGEGLTVAVAFPKGFVHPPSTTKRLLTAPAFLTAALGLLLVTAYFLFVWWKVGRDPRQGILIPLFAPPNDMSAPGTRYVRRMGFDDKTFAAGLVQMAVEGGLVIERVKRVYVLTRGQKDFPGGSWQGAVSQKLLGAADSIRLERANHATLKAARKSLRTSLELAYRGKLFHANRPQFFLGVALSAGVMALTAKLADEPAAAGAMIAFLCVWTFGAAVTTFRWIAALGQAKNRPRFRTIGGAIILTLFAIPMWIAAVFIAGLLSTAVSIPAAVALAAIGGMNAVFWQLLKAPTPEGRRVMDAIEGFRLYLAVGEKERLELLNPPDRTVELFERYLPYALALGVENAWAAQFKDALARAEAAGSAPIWYTGQSWSSLGSSDFASGFADGFSSAISAASSAPGSSSGSGGGGSSGGGGGGGGGGGW